MLPNYHNTDPAELFVIWKDFELCLKKPLQKGNVVLRPTAFPNNTNYSKWLNFTENLFL